MAKYDPLRRHLEGQIKAEVLMDFREIEQVLSSKLPPSASTHRAWWANQQSGSHIHFRSWLHVGFSTDQVDFVRERVTFRRNPG